MFDSIRNNSKIWMGLLVLLIIPSFVLFGIEGYKNADDKGAVVAKIDGQKIYQSEWDAVHKSEVDRVRASVPNLDPKLFDSFETRYAALERLVNERLISLVAQKQMLTTSDQRLTQHLQKDPSIAALRGPDGKLDMDRYRQMAASQGMTPEMLEARVRQDLANQQVIAGLQGSVFATQRQTEIALDAFLQRREIQVKRWTPADFVAKVVLTDAGMQDFYKANPARFRSSENADVEYLVLDLATLQSKIELSEQDLKSHYEQNKQRLTGLEQRRASHILINAAKDASAADKQKARTKAEDLLASVRKSPKSFAELARQNSDDTGSAASGGDLDFFARGAMVKPFEEAAFAMKKGDISAVVESDFGFHIIELTDIKLPPMPTFEAMRPELEADLRKQQAQKQFSELAESFSNSVYEQSEGFGPVAERLKLSVQKAQAVPRYPAPGAKDILSNRPLLQAIFAEETIVKRRNTAAIEVAPNTLVSARIVTHHPASVRPFDDVNGEVRRLMTQFKSAELAKAEGQARLKAWQADASLAVLDSAVTVSRDQAAVLPQAVIDAALRADPAKMATLIGVDLDAQGYAVVKLNKIMPRAEQTPALAEQSRQQFGRLWGQAEGQAYLASLKSQYKVEILAEKPKKAEPATE